MKVSTRQALKRSRSAVVVQHLLKNIQSSRRLAQGDIATETYMHDDDSADAKLAYARTTLDAYGRYGDLHPDWLSGKQVLEVGHGDTFLIAISLVLRGAASVTCLDRFDVRKNEVTERMAYQRVADGVDGEASARLRSALANAEFDRVLEGMGVRQIYLPLEEASTLSPQTFDLMLSMATLEHVSDIDAAFRAMDSLLSQSGRMIHCVDLRDHGMFSSGGQHPLTFLTVPESVYVRMSSNTYAPNRRRLDAYLSCLENLGYRCRCYVSRVLGSDTDVGPIPWDEFDVSAFPEARDLIAQVRRRLREPYRGLDDSILAVATFGFQAERA